MLNEFERRRMTREKIQDGGLVKLAKLNVPNKPYLLGILIEAHDKIHMTYTQEQKAALEEKGASLLKARREIKKSFDIKKTPKADKLSGFINKKL